MNVQIVQYIADENGKEKNNKSHNQITNSIYPYVRYTIVFIIKLGYRPTISYEETGRYNNNAQQSGYDNNAQGFGGY